MALLALPALPARAASSTDDTWSVLGKDCTANAFLKRNSGNDGWVCSNVSGEKVFIQTILLSTGASQSELSSSGFTSTGPVVFSSNVVITGDLRVNSTKAKALFLPTGGIHLDDGGMNSAVAPGQMFSKKVVASTITLIGSALLFQDSVTGVINSTMSSTTLDIGTVLVGTVTATSVSGKIRTTAGGAGAPANEDCDGVDEQGAMYLATNPGRFYICDFNGASGWRFGTLSP